MSFMLVWILAIHPSGPLGPTPTTPTEATSPSINALVAWVVEWATKITSLGSIAFSFRQFWKACTTPAATPALSSWVVFTEDFPMISCVALSMATALVWVPPTSMPMRTFLSLMLFLLLLSLLSLWRSVWHSVIAGMCVSCCTLFWSSEHHVGDQLHDGADRPCPRQDLL